MSTPGERGLVAVRRVRSARERDSRIGLQQALAVTRQRDAEAERSHERLDAAPAFGAGTADQYRMHRVLVTALAEEHARKHELARSSHTVADEAKRRWAQDRQAVRVVELLLERRAAERLQERARHDARDLDELAGQAWLRRQVPAGKEPRR